MKWNTYSKGLVGLGCFIFLVSYILDLYRDAKAALNNMVDKNKSAG